MLLCGKHSTTMQMRIVSRFCRQYTSHVTFFCAQCACWIMCCTTHWLKCLHERVTSSAWSSTLCGCPFFDSLFLALFLSVCFSYLFFFYLNPELNLFLHVVDIGAINHWHSANWGVWPPGRKHPSHRLWAQAPWRLPLLGDCWNLPPGRIQRHGALVLVWRGTRRRDHRQSALFTTVHSGARRTSEPQTSFSLFWRNFVASSVLFCVSLKNGETLTRT